LITFGGIERAEEEAIMVVVACLKVLLQNSPGGIPESTCNSVLEPKFESYSLG
jgi:hypothetical protein